MKDKLKVVFDTNIFISAIIFGGNPRTCLELAREGKIQLFSSLSILLELAKKLAAKFGWKDKDIKEVIQGISKFAVIIKPTIKIDKIKGDKTDNRILECAVTAKADCVISGDKHHLLSLKKFENIPILSSTQFLNKFFG